MECHNKVRLMGVKWYVENRVICAHFHQYHVANENNVYFFPKPHLRDLLSYNYEKQNYNVHFFTIIFKIIFLQLSKKSNMI